MVTKITSTKEKGKVVHMGPRTSAKWREIQSRTRMSARELADFLADAWLDRPVDPLSLPRRGEASEK